jgi:uncharacterized repeat protein (TIGR01451 family)
MISVKMFPASGNVRRSLSYLTLLSLVCSSLAWPLHAALAASAFTPHRAATSENPRESARPRSDAATATKRAAAEKDYGRLPLHFEANEGQLDKRVRFVSRGSGYSLFLTQTEAVLALRRQPARDSSPGVEQADRDESVDVLRMRMVGAKRTPQVAGLDLLPGAANYFQGSDPREWRTQVRTYAKVGYADVYPGVDLVHYGNQRQLEYDFIVRPGARASAIRLAFEGGRTRLDANGELVVQTSRGEVRQPQPFAYQETNGVRQQVSCSYALDANGRVSFRLGDYDQSLPLVIDPVLAYSTYLGGSGFDQGMDIAVDAGGNAYVVGTTAALDFPTTAGSYQSTPPGSFVTKINSLGDVLVYSTYLAGGGGMAVAVDASGNAYVAGDALTTDFPVTPGAFQTAPSGYDISVTKLNATGSALIYSSRFGGQEDDHARAIALDTGGNAYVTGWMVCRSSTCTFPTVNAFQPTYGGGNNDAFLTKLNATGSALVYSTFLGGGRILNATDDWAEGVAVDSAGSAYVTGYTYSPDFPVTPGVFQPNRLGLDAFITKFSTDGRSLVYSTFFGGNGQDMGRAIVVDDAGNAYVAGETTSQDNPFTTSNDGLPVTPGAFQTTGSFDAFVAKLNAQGSGLIYSTYLGGTDDVDRAWGIAIDKSGNAYVTGDTKSANFPVANAVQSTYGSGLGDAFVTKLNATGSALLYSTFLGGSLTDEGRGIAVDGSGNAYVVGHTSSFNFPIANPLQPTNGGGIDNHDDAFVAKLSETAAPPVTADLSLSMTDSPDPVGMGANLTYTITVRNAGLDAAASTALTVRLNPSFAFISGTPAQGTCTVPDNINTLSCSLGTIANSATARVTITVRTPMSSGAFRSDAFVSSTAFDPNNADNTTAAVTTINNTTPTSSVVLSSLTINPSSVVGGASAQGTVTLSGNAPAGGATVALSSNNALARTPASVFIPAGTRSASFTIATSSTTTNATASISAALGGVTKTALLTITPAAASVDTVGIQQADYTVSKKELRIQATSTRTTATLQAYVTASGALIGTLKNNGGGKYGAQFSWPVNPQQITVKSSFGGSATKAVANK